MLSPHPKREEIIHFLRSLREDIISAFEELEDGKTFERKTWTHHQEGGGEMAVLRGSRFEKAAVNWSGVGGSSFPMADGLGPFFATGVSLITHMANPHAPTTHFNIRFIETQGKYWFGGGYDLTPMGFPYEEDTQYFHQVAKEALDPFGPDFYPVFSQQARDYFYIPHRKKERGIGGIFFDHFNTGDFDVDYQLWMAVGRSFLKAVLPLYRKRLHQPYTNQEREQQLLYRGHYAEFNLVYDRGTKFGFQSGGNTEAILCSMPPLAKW
ncbi:oxygen-dependent coproporphyrinogen oxidase [Candidatus Protochlamydia phocaeensis]|uniref:oxygen-dependent coproporphyrinogen oxidase n=1 Tax=Candidatus Protochlamydia phocaeensis TaxID=1414722 RepID=UPI0008383FA3|nr:oxygen-dependent coproporphyrinogen oxidase [Candidatus Protochlamydia phocaeensis]